MVAQMLNYELKKIFSRPVNKIVTLALIAIAVAAGLLAVRDVRYLTADGYIHGAKAAKQLKEEKNQWRGALTEQALQKAVQTNQELHAGIGREDYAAMDEALQKGQGLKDIRDMISLAFSGFKNYDYYRADSVTTEEAGSFYQQRIAGLKEWLDSGEGNFSQKEQAFLIKQFEKTHTPFHYEYAEGWKTLLDSQYLPILTIIVVIVCGFLVAGIFSGEFQLRADSIFFSSKLGRGRAVLSKLGSGILTVSVVYWGAMLLYAVLVLGLLGFGGASCEVQIGNWKSIYNLTYGQDALLTLAGGYIGCLFISTLAMLVSAKSRSMAIAVTIPFLLSCIPMFLGRIPFLSRIMTLFPDQLLQISMNLDTMKLYEIGGKVMGHLSVIVPLYLLLWALAVPALYWLYRRAEVK